MGKICVVSIAYGHKFEVNRSKRLRLILLIDIHTQLRKQVRKNSSENITCPAHLVVRAK